MKILVVGDPHFRFEMPYASAFEDGRKAEWERVKETILYEANKVDAVCLIGDNFNARHNHSTVINEFIGFLKSIHRPIYIIAGNHERYGASTALDFLEKVDMPDWHVYTEVAQDISIVGGNAELVRATFIPYMTPALLGVTTKEEGERALMDSLKPVQIVFAHHAITGTKSTEFFNEIVLDKAKMEAKFGMTFGGHVHKPERLSNKVIVTGNIFTQEVGEPRKNVWIWDSATNTTLEVPLPVRGIYKIVWEERDEKEIIPSNSIVKCYVTNRETPLEDVKKFLSFFDASIIVEQYPNVRSKVHFEEGGLDLSVDSMLKRYAEAKNLSYPSLKEGFELITK